MQSWTKEMEETNNRGYIFRYFADKTDGRQRTSDNLFMIDELTELRKHSRQMKRNIDARLKLVEDACHHVTLFYSLAWSSNVSDCRSTADQSRICRI